MLLYIIFISITPKWIRSKIKKVLDELASVTSIFSTEHISHFLFLNGNSCGSCDDKFVYNKLYKIMM